ncbi:MAG: sulfotransferase [Erythrobacter sp.]|uniref:sulfotransferase n=1 Tax=Erythrobacter sp. TaxID=1042 RepID=UPI003C780A2D
MKLHEAHSVPHFDGTASRAHRDAALWRLSLDALPATLQHAGSFAAADAFVQFVGFPRSGHSLVGSILDAHPQAVIAHELDVMGLVAKNVPLALISGMIARNASAFTATGRWWNGFSYTVPEGSHAIPARPAVIGDKKGDWAVRRCDRDPSLLERARRVLGDRDRWVLVVRHPADNIATMSLRLGKAYDKLRIESARSGFDRELRAAQHDGRVPDSIADAMIDDYENLCASIERMQRQLPRERWHSVVYEDFAARPRDEIAALYGFAGLEAHESLVSSAAGIVRVGKSRSRDRIGWSAAQENRVREIIDRFAFLAPYRTAG